MEEKINDWDGSQKLFNEAELIDLEVYYNALYF
jgi:hypothetical protein